MSTDTLVKHSKRTLRTPCDTCGAMNLYKGHDTSKRGDYWVKSRDVVYDVVV
ncbi:hypothetical protein [Mycobacteroides abscessus]|uniref:hypothetical protein n=1 Tax=Mycobacteroides abscessus TaxID=36809 RepID=UPI0018968BA9|nr:hypothetical protein [Mycobacteroides abscessus]